MNRLREFCESSRQCAERPSSATGGARKAMSTPQDSTAPAVGQQRLVRRCVTHHFACDCREALMTESMQTQRRIIDWCDQSDEGLRLRCGELTAQEIRTIRAVLNAIRPPNEELTRRGCADKTTKGT